MPIEAGQLGPIFDRYEREHLPKKAPRTQRDDAAMLKILRQTFGAMPIDSIRPRHIRAYLDKRTAKIRANREISVFSRVWNHAREWGYTDRANPVAGVEKNKETGRDIYVTDIELALVHKHAPPVVQDLLDISYLIGQRPGDVRKLRWDQVQDGCLCVTQGKTKVKLRIAIKGDLAAVLERARTRGTEPPAQRFAHRFTGPLPISPSSFYLDGIATSAAENSGRISRRASQGLAAHQSKLTGSSTRSRSLCVRWSTERVPVDPPWCQHGRARGAEQQERSHQQRAIFGKDDCLQDGGGRGQSARKCHPPQPPPEDG